MAKYTISFNPRLETQMIQHAEFIARVSKPAALNFRNEFAKLIKHLSDDPHQFPPYDDPNLPPGVYRKALFAKWYKAVFYIENDIVYVDAIVDGRADYNTKND